MSSEDPKELIGALVKAKGQMGAIVKDRENPFFKSTYATLGSVLEAVEPALLQNGLAIVQGMDGGALVTALYHVSGQSIRFSYPINPVKPDPQGIGSAVTYARRYSLMALLSLNAEDDDGQAASARPKRAVPSAPAPSAGKAEESPKAITPPGGKKTTAEKPGCITARQASFFWVQADKAGVRSEDVVKEKLKELGYASTLDIPKGKFDALLNWVKDAEAPAPTK